VPAALVMAALRAYLRGATVQYQTDPRALVTMTNDLLYECVPTGRFATLFYGVYDPASRTLEYVNAGHLPPVLLRSDNGSYRLQRLETGGVATGLMPGAQYASERIHLEPGDRLIIFTDGITEALNADGDEWGEDQLIALLQSHPQSSARALADAVLTRVDDFARGTSQYDDMTVAALRVM
jgi:phosphoserine phosphatase RsbU/P